jgi:signal transduction histidine kinase
MALLFGILLGLGVIVLSYFGYYFARGHFIYGVEDAVRTEISYLSVADEKSLKSRLSAPPEGRLYMLSGPDGDYQGGNLQVLPRNKASLADGKLLLLTMPDGRRYVAQSHVFNDGRRLLAGVEVTRVVHDYNIMLGLSLLSIILMLTVIGVSFFISTFVVSRTNRIAATAKQIMDTGNLSQRLEVDSKWDDLSYVSTVLNAFLERTERLVEGVTRVSDNIAHDLRTPLTRLRNRLEKLQSAGNPAADDLLTEADQLLSTFNSLLRISRIENAQQKAHFAPVALNEVISDVAELYEPTGEAKGIRTVLSLEQEAVVTGDRDLLFQVFANLLDNAIKFSPADSVVTVTLRNEGGIVTACIQDQGPGIPDIEKEQVFSRFFRGDASRHTPGSGLGLSLVMAAARLHGARITLEDATPGLNVRIVF